MNVTITVATAPVALPAGITAGPLSLSITDPTGNAITNAAGTAIVAQTVTDNSAVFADVPPGDYVASAVRLDANGNSIGHPITQAFSVPVPTVTYDAPQSITVTLA